MENVVYKILLKIPTNALGFINVNLLHKGHIHVSVTHMAFFSMMTTKIQINVSNQYPEVAETCLWSLSNTINSNASGGLCNKALCIQLMHGKWNILVENFTLQLLTLIALAMFNTNTSEC